MPKRCYLDNGMDSGTIDDGPDGTLAAHATVRELDVRTQSLRLQVAHPILSYTVDRVNDGLYEARV